MILGQLRIWARQAKNAPLTMCCALWAGELYKFQGSAWNRGFFFIWEKRARQDQRKQCIFSFWKKVNSKFFTYLKSGESSRNKWERGTGKPERERQSRGTACHRWRIGASAMACKSNADLLSWIFLKLTQWDVRFCNADVSVKCPVALRALSFDWPTMWEY